MKKPAGTTDPTPIQKGSTFDLERIPAAAITATLFVFVLGIYWASPVVTVTDSLWTLYVSASILQEGDANLDEYVNLIDLEDDLRVRSSKGHIYSNYPVATALISAPVLWAADQYYSVRNSGDFFIYLKKHKPDDFTGRLEKFIGSLYAALSTVPIFLIGSYYLRRRQALLLTLLFAFSTSMWSTASRALWQHGPSVLFLSIALYLTLLAQEREPLIQYVGFFIAVAYVIRPNNSLSVLFTSLYVLVNHRSYFGRYLVNAAVVATPFVANNLLVYDAILPPYFLQLFGRFGSLRGFPEALAGTMISPGRGLFIFTPIFLFSIHGMFLLFKQGSLTVHSVQLYLLAIILGHWLIISSFADWDGSWSIGPRYFTDTTPYLTFFLIPVLQHRERIFSRRVWKSAFLSAAILSTLIHFRCATSIYPFLWNNYPVTYPDGATYRDWDWSDLQFLRGFCPEDPEKGQAPACWIK